MKTVAIMPIKLKNERCQGKNIRLLGNKPLLQYELDNLNATNLVDSINVYCSSNEIIQFLPKYVNFIKRPSELDLPSSNFTQIFESFMNECFADIYIFAHATAPFITLDTMRECISAVQSGKYDSAFCAEKIQTFLWQNGMPMNFDATNLPRTQDLVPVYKETSGVYVFTREVFEKHKRRIGVKPFIKCISLKEAIDIDNPEDFILAEKLLNIQI